MPSSKLDIRAAQINADTTLSFGGQRRAIKTQETYKDAVLKAFEAVRKGYKASVDGLATYQKLFYMPDHLPSDDLVGRMNDAEIRDWWRKLVIRPNEASVRRRSDSKVNTTTF